MTATTMKSIHCQTFSHRKHKASRSSPHNSKLERRASLLSSKKTAMIRFLSSICVLLAFFDALVGARSVALEGRCRSSFPKTPSFVPRAWNCAAARAAQCLLASHEFHVSLLVSRVDYTVLFSCLLLLTITYGRIDSAPAQLTFYPSSF